MASPQLEDGYVKLANELLDALARCCLPGAQAQVVWAIFRRTYGWKKKTDSISIGQLVKMCQFSRRTAIYTIQDLEAKNMIFVERKCKETNKITFNKNYDSWLVQNFAPQTNKNRENARLRKTKVVQNFASPSAKLCTTIDYNSNDTNKISGNDHLVQNFAPSAKLCKKVVQNVAPTKEKKQKKETRARARGFFLPDFLDPDLWEAFRQHRIALKAKMTPQAEKLMIEKLSRFVDEGFSAEEIINQSIERGWKGIFEPKEFSGNGKKQKEEPYPYTKHPLGEKYLEDLLNGKLDSTDVD